LCCVQVPRCYWRRHRTIKGFFWCHCQSWLATTFGSGFFLSTGRLNLGIITEGKLTAALIIPSSWGFPTGLVRHQNQTLFYITVD
jgi:hypothetical protein